MNRHLEKIKEEERARKTENKKTGRYARLVSVIAAVLVIGGVLFQRTSGKSEKIGGISGWRRRGEEDFPAEFDQVKGYEIRQKLRPSQAQKKQKAGTQRKKSAGERDGVHNRIPEKRPLENQEDRITETAGRKRTIPPESLCTRRNRSLPT